MDYFRSERDRVRMRWVACLALAWGATVGACGGKATTRGGDGDGDGDGNVSGDGDAPGSGGNSAPGDGDGDEGGDGDGDVDRSCGETADCALVSATCCGTCGSPTLSDVTAIRADHIQAFRESLCPEDFGCPDCAVFPNPNLFAECRAGTCEAVDLTDHADSACTTQDDCTLLPNACCECGAGTEVWDIVAINRDRTSGFVASNCATQGQGEPVGCDGCLWSAPVDVVAECVSGHCRVGMASTR